MASFSDWVLIFINIQTLWTNLLIKMILNINGTYQQEIIRELYECLTDGNDNT